MSCTQFAFRLSMATVVFTAGLLVRPLVAQTGAPTSPGAPTSTSTPPAPGSERGAINFNFNSGWSFGFPAVRAFVSVPRVGTAISPEKSTLPAAGAGLSVRAWKFVVPFVDFMILDTGKATAQVGSLKSEIQANTYSYHGGVRLVGSKSRLRPYIQFAGGAVRQDAKGTFVENGRTSPFTGTGTRGSLLFGGGFQTFLGRKWGSEIGFDGFRLTVPLVGGKQSYSRIHLGFFYQTKPSRE